MRERRNVPGVALGALAAAAAGISGCAAPPAAAHVPSRPVLAATTRLPAPGTAVVTGSPAVIAVRVARRLFAAAPVVVVASASHRADVDRAARWAERAHAPLLLLTSSRADRQPGRSADSGSPAAGRDGVNHVVRGEIDKLHPRAVLAVGTSARRLAAELPGVSVVTHAAALPATAPPARAGRVLMLVPQGDAGAAVTAAATTARVAGARVVAAHGDDPQSRPVTYRAVASLRPQRVIAVGGRFRPTADLGPWVTAALPHQLPGGGWRLFPMRRMVALYGHPGYPALGVLGAQDLRASITRARQVAAAYQPLSKVPVVPAFEIIATVALGFPGSDGTYSYTSPVSLLRQWIQRATEAGMYVVLDLQPGRASFLAQAKMYKSLLELPNVGLALDPEWKLAPGELPLRQIGSVGIGEVNSVVSWLATLTARHHLPQKLLELHEFRLSMIRGELRLDTGHRDLAVLINMDGQGTPQDKFKTWAAIKGAAPPRVFLGWKNFYRKDHPTLTPQQTMQQHPKPVIISYQ